MDDYKKTSVDLMDRDNRDATENTVPAALAAFARNRSLGLQRDAAEKQQKNAVLFPLFD